MAKEKLEDELNEKKRAAEGIEFVSDIKTLSQRLRLCYFNKTSN